MTRGHGLKNVCEWKDIQHLATYGNVMQYAFLAGFEFRSCCVACTCAACALIDLSTLPVLVKGLCSATVV